MPSLPPQKNKAFPQSEVPFLTPLFSTRRGSAFRSRATPILLALFSLALSGSCKRPSEKRASDTGRRETMTRFKEVIEQAGSSEVWVKTPHRNGSFPPPRANTPVVSLAASGTYDTVLSVIRKESKRQGLESEFKESRSQDRWRETEIILRRGGDLLGRWQLREVRHLRRAGLIIDDLGEDLVAARKLLELPYPLSLATLPHLPHSTQIAREAHRAGREVLLHLPMEPEPGSPTAPGPGEIRVGMRSNQVVRIIEGDLASVPGCVGVNNHMGSRATADSTLMAAVMKVLSEHHLCFVDSRTTTASVALEMARRQGIPAFYRSVFLDDTPTVPYSLRQLHKLQREVEEQDVALAIGHPYPTTVTALAQFLPELEQHDIQLVPVSHLVRLPEVARLSPPRQVR